MSGYKSAPATRLLATHCVACGRQLVDAKSVEAGMGPDCRERHGYEDEGTEEERAEMNRRVHALALWRSSKKQMTFGDQKPPTVDEAAEHLKAVRGAGFVRLAAILEDRLCDVVIKEVNAQTFALHTNYNDRLVPSLRRLAGRFDPSSKAWLFHNEKQKRKDLFKVLCYFFPSSLGIGPKGVFVLRSVVSH